MKYIPELNYDSDFYYSEPLVAYFMRTMLKGKKKNERERVGAFAVVDTKIGTCNDFTEELAFFRHVEGGTVGWGEQSCWQELMKSALLFIHLWYKPIVDIYFIEITTIFASI